MAKCYAAGVGNTSGRGESEGTARAALHGRGQWGLLWEGERVNERGGSWMKSKPPFPGFPSRNALSSPLGS